ncbi:MAG: glycosyltransferase family 61 protein [Verrucomicrobia bacterium]|nr:glycosyltransferase family 61 protein [Verrucomicrobiota bacterium]
MGDAGLRAVVLSRLKRLGPLYRLARSVRRGARTAALETLRRTLPPWPRVGPAKGVFSAGDELRAGRLAGELILEGQECPPAPPGSLRRLAGLRQDGYQPWPVFWTRHRDARLAGEAMLLLDDRKRACAEAVFREQQNGDPGFNFFLLPPPVRLAGNWTSVLSRWSLDLNFYHWMTDCLPRLAVLDRFPPDTRILVPATLKPHHVQTLRLLGLEGRAERAVHRHVLVENFYFSAPTAMTGCASPYAVKFLREKFLPLADAEFRGPEKFYVVRRGKTRGILNEPEVVKFFEARGWAIVDLEPLSIAQQVKLFSGARFVCGMHGAAFTNLLWARPGCTALELVARNYLNGAFESIASCVGVEHRFLVCDADVNACLRVDLGELAKALGD